MYGVSYTHNETITTTIEGQAGVEELSQPAGAVTIEAPDGSTSVKLTVNDRQGNEAYVFLDWHQVAMVMMALGNAGAEL